MKQTNKWASFAVAIALAAGTWLSCAPAAAAAVTGSTVSAPTNPSFFQLNGDNPADPSHQITVSGTTTNDGTSGNVNLVCTYAEFGGGTGDTTLAFNVAVNPDGTFSWTGPPFSSSEPCVLRAVPAGSALPSNLASFSGPTVGLGDFNTFKLTSGPNTGQLYDFYDNADQLAGDADYESAGSGALFDAYPVDPSSLVLGEDMFFSNNYLSDANSDRSDIEVDGIPAYLPATAEQLLAGSGNFSGLPAVSFTTTQDPQTGDLTINESEPLVQCAPTPATYPPTTASCTSFASTGVTLSRTIVQDQGGRQAQITDTYTSADGLSHAIDLRYGQDFQEANAGFNFPWADGSTYNTHVAGDTEPAPASAPATMYVNWNNALADGAQDSAQGAITFSDEPSGFQFVSNGLNGHTHMYVSYARTIPAGGTVKLTTTYSWAFTVADVQALVPFATAGGSEQVVATGGATAVTSNSATVSGSVNPNGTATTYHFEYGTTPSYGSVTTPVSAGSGSTATSVNAGLTGLQPSTLYYYRLVATTSAGTIDGAQATFTTAAPPPPPVVTTGSSSSITSSGATIAGTVNPNGLATSYHFEYGTTPSYGTSTTPTSAGSGSTASPATASLTGLAPNTLYYYRLVATNSTGTTDGSQATFTTAAPPPPPVVTTGTTSSITTSGATVAGTVNPNGLTTSYHFEYGTTPSYGTSTGSANTGNGSTATSVNANLTGLAPNTLYYYRLVATNSTGTTDGSQATFTTAALPPPPAVTTGSSSSITSSGATVAGTVNPNGTATTYHFEYGTTPSYGSVTTPVSAGSGSTATSVNAGLTGLQPSTLYYYRLVATTSAGTIDGAQATFTTAAPPPPPVVTTGTTSSITSSGATVAGTVNPNGLATSYHFDYGTNPSFGSSTATTSAGSGSSASSVTANLTGLQPNTFYYYRLVATNASGTTRGSRATFTTAALPPPPAVTTGAGSAITTTGATIAGSVNPNGLATMYHFEYGTTPTYGTSTTPTSAGSGSTASPATANLTGLLPNTLYYYRLVATNTSGTTDGSQATFTTASPPPPPPPVVTTGSTSAITTTGAKLSGSVNPNGLATSYHFEYGTTPSYGTSTGSANAGNGSSPTSVNANLTGLAPNTLYYYRLVATNSTGTTDGSQATFTTATTPPPPPPPPAPAASTGSAWGITTSAATIAGSLNPNGQATTYHFEYGTTASYGTSTGSASAGSGSTATSVHADLTGLRANTVYYYRLVAKSASGTAHGTQQTFKTATASSPPPPPPPPPITTSLTVGAIKVRANTASIQLSCVGSTGARCVGTLTASARVKHHRKHVTVSVGTASYTIAAGSGTTSELTLNHAGRVAMMTAHGHKLRVTLVVMLGTKPVATKTLVFKAHVVKARRRKR